MTAPHLVPVPGRCADFAADLRARLPELRTDRTILRAPRLEDAPHWCAILEADTAGHIGGPHTPDDAFREFAATVGLWLLRGHGMWTVTDPAGAVLGFVLIGFEPGDHEPELGYLFCARARGTGVAFEAATAARDHALGSMGLPSLVSYIAPGNAASRRLAERLGARFTGTAGWDPDPAPAEIWRHAPLQEPA